MDILDKYKKAWDQQPDDPQKVSKANIYSMSRSTSSSIVKWIFIFGILEFVFWAVLNILFLEDTYHELYKNLHITNFISLSVYVHYIVIVIFLFLFYRNYKSISISDSTKTLINKILKTRKVVNYYVYFNLIYAILANIVVFTSILNNLDSFIKYYKMYPVLTFNNQYKLILFLASIMVISLILMSFLLWMFYKLIYGGLLKKLNKNYNDLVKLEETE